MAGSCLYVLLGLLSLFAISILDQLLGPVGLGAEPGTASWGVLLAVHPVVWGLTTALIAVPFGRRLVPGLQFSARASAVLAAGLLLAAITTYLLHEFARERYGWFDPEYVGLANVAAPTVVAVSLAAWAASAVPYRNRWPLVVAHVAAVAALGLALVPSLPGLQDGIRASSVPLAVILAIDASFAVGSVRSGAVERLRRGPTP